MHPRAPLVSRPATVLPAIPLAAHLCGDYLVVLDRNDRYFTASTSTAACNDVLARRDDASALVELRFAYHAWLPSDGFPEDWLAIAGHAERALPTPGAAKLGAAALVNAAAMADCSDRTRDAILANEPDTQARTVTLVTFSTTCDLPGMSR